VKILPGFSEVPPMFYDPSRFAFVPALEAAAPRFLEEFHRIKHRLVGWVERELYGEGWDVYQVFSFPHGEPLGDLTSACPFTAAWFDQHVPRHGVVGFSVLQPRTHIRPHEGYQGAFLRGHLPLIVPEGDCCLRVRSEVRSWQTGQAMIFDDRVEHEAWNRTDEARVVLLFDFIPS
jgi:beta-hydroxylase